MVVGCDQRERSEYVRLISKRINTLVHVTLNIDRELVPKPRSCFGRSVKLMPLQAPTVKMSKSTERELGCVYVLDDYAATRTKVVCAKTGAQLQLFSDVSGLNNRPRSASLIEACALTAGLLLLARIGKANVEGLNSVLCAKAFRTSTVTKQ